MACFELLVHAEEHFRKEGDIDKRLAVIGFDNAIESAITTYLSLKPVHRQGRKYKRKDVEAWLQDHTTKVRFFYEELERRSLENGASEAELLWYHHIRNDVYHSGIGVIPNEQCLTGIREAAAWVFSVLFEIPDAEVAVFEAVQGLSPQRDSALDAYLDETAGPVVVAGTSYEPGQVLLAVDPMLYTQMARDYARDVEGEEPREYTMIEIDTDLFVGDQGDYEYQVKGKEGWAVVHACKEPYHRQLLGYTTRGAPKDHPEYYFAERDNRLYLNLVDAPNPAYIPQEIIDKAIAFIHEKLGEGRKVLVHCNQGESRSPGIGLMYLLKHTDVLPKTSLDEALAAFRNLYPAFHPSGGISGFIEEHWNDNLARSGSEGTGA